MAGSKYETARNTLDSVGNGEKYYVLCETFSFRWMSLEVIFTKKGVDSFIIDSHSELILSFCY